MRTAKLIVFGLILFLSGAAFSFVFKNDVNHYGVNHSELFELKRKCATLAKNFIDKKSEEQSHTKWSVLRTDYNIQRQSCFGEFNVHVDPSLPDQSFSEFKIYDLLTGQQIEGLTYSQASGSSESFSKYLITAQPQYQKTRSEIFFTKSP